MTVSIKFPENFLWGSASSAPQMEGESLNHGKGKTLWDFWYETEPEKFFNGVGPKNTTNFYNMYKEDVQRMKEVGFNSYRTSISWARLIPGGKGEVNKEAIDFYNNVINEMIENNIEPVMNLYHFDMPMEMQEIGGWESRAVVEAFANYAKICYELFGDRVKKWATFNEPIVPVEAGYLYKFHYPNIVDMKRAVQVAYNTMIASARAIEEYRNLKQDGGICVILNLTPSYPRNPEDAEDVKAAHIADLFFNRSFLDPSVKGEYPRNLIQLIKDNDLMPTVEEGDTELIKNNTVDFLGVNYYQPRRIKKKEEAMPKQIMPESFFDNYDMPGKKINPHRGWEIYEKGIYDLAINLRDNYGNLSWFISENGMGVEGEDKFLNAEGTIEDDYRIDFMKDHLTYLHKAIEEGANCFGYHTWTFIDNWSWTNAYKNRYGFYRLDLDTFERTIKKSGKWFKELTTNNGF